MTCLPPPPDVPYGDPGPSLWIRLLTRARDSRRVWDIMGSLYNRGINGILTPLNHIITGELKISGRALLLDVGAGRGTLTALLAAQNPCAQVIGVDYSLRQVREAEEYRREKGTDNCSFEQGNAMDLHFPSGMFDAAASVGSIKHWPDAPRGLREIHRVLKPGGMLMIAETDREASDEELQNFVRRFRMRFVPDGLHFWGLRHVVFGQSFSQDDLAASVREAGFRDVTDLRCPQLPYVIVKARK